MVELTFGFPPSVNTYYRTAVVRGQQRTMLSADGRTYKSNAEARYPFPPHQFKATERLFVTLRLYPPDKRRRDVDNHAKAVLDVLQHLRVIEDDAQVDELLIKREPINRNAGFVLVQIEVIPDGEST